MAKIVCIDSDYDEIVRLVAEWRRANVYPDMQNHGHELEILKDNLAVRSYLQQALLEDNVVFLSGSGHGLFHEFQGNDTSGALEVGNYRAGEVKDKIIHLLSCQTAFKLGVDIVKSGCSAFFGYDFPFTYHKEYLDYFMAPDASLDKAIYEGKPASSAHQTLMEVYDKTIAMLQNQRASLYAITDMMINRDHFCSPAKNKRWGDPNAKV